MNEYPDSEKEGAKRHCGGDMRCNSERSSETPSLLEEKMSTKDECADKPRREAPEANARRTCGAIEDRESDADRWIDNSSEQSRWQPRLGRAFFDRNESFHLEPAFGTIPFNLNNPREKRV